MCLVLACPAVNEEAGRGEEGWDAEEWDAKLGFANAVVTGFQAAVDAVVEWSTDLRAQPEANSEGDIV